jgi:ketosteroid isomerase-like protein
MTSTSEENQMEGIGTIEGEAALRDLVDKEQIREVVARYFRGVDRKEWDLVRSCYHPDALDEHGPLFSGPATGFVDWVSGWIDERFSVTMHIGGQSLIELDGDVAHGETYANAMHRTHPDADGVELDLVVAARLLDRFERRDGGRWAIAHRRLVPDWTRLDRVDGSITVASLLQTDAESH